MIDPSLVKTVGFIAALVGTAGSAAVLFLPKCLTKWEKSIRIVFISLALLGILSNRFGDYIISTANGPRNMSPADWSLLSDKMKAYSGEQYKIFLYTDEVEAINLVKNLKTCLDNAGWKYSPPNLPIDPEQLIGAGFLGVLVLTDDTSDQKTKDAARLLVNALNKKWIISRWNSEPPTTPNKIVIHIFTRIRAY